MRLSVLIASSGRPTLARAIESVAGQLEPGDELMLDVNDDAPWGHAARNRMMPRARGDALMFLDDDDCYEPGALSAVREAVERQPRAVHLFRMRYSDGSILWRDGDLRVYVGNVSTQMVVVPNRDGLGRWGDRYEGDFDFISSTLHNLDVYPVWHERVIARVRPDGG